MSYDPTPAMIERCQSWLKVVDTLEKYLNAASVRYDWINEATSRLSREMPQPEDLGEQFAPIGKGGIKDVFVKLWWDLNLPDGKAAESASKIIKEELLREVESLKADLERSISDFNDHSASFDNHLAPSKTAALRDPKLNSKITEYQRAVAAAEAGKQPEIDPYLLKLNLDRRIDSSVRKHNRQADSYSYVQDAAKRVDGEVTERIQKLLKRYTDIVERNGNIIAGGGRAIRSVFVNQPQLFEYKHWLSSNKAPSTFVGSKAEATKKRESDSDLGYPMEDSVYSKAVRIGSLERRSKILRTYSPGEYVLTPQSLIELRQNQPVWSIDLIGAKLLDDHKADAEDHFVLEAKQHGSNSGKLHKFIFRANVAANWKRDLKAICDGQIPPSLSSIVKAQNTAEPVSHEQFPDKQLLDQETVATNVYPPSTAPPPVQQAQPIHSEAASPTVAAAAPNDLAADQPAAGAGAAPIASEKTAAKEPFSDSAQKQNFFDPVAEPAPPSPQLQQQPPQQPLQPQPQEHEPINTSKSVTSAQPITTTVAVPASQVANLDIKANAPTSQTSSSVVGAASQPEDPFADKVSVAESDKAAVGIAPPSNIQTPVNASPVASPRPTGIPEAGAIGELSDSEVSDVDQGYEALRKDHDDVLNEEGTLAWRAKQDMAVFDRPVGAAGQREAQHQVAGVSGVGTTTVGSSGVSAGKQDLDSSVWYYDSQNKDSLNTLKRDVGFEPADSNIPVETERRLSRTTHKYEKPEFIATRDPTDANETNEEVLKQRRSSVSSGGLQRKGSRKATGSFGKETGDDLKPLTALSSAEKDALAKSANESPFYFSEGLPNSTTGKQ